MNLVLTIMLGYLVGSASFGIIVTKLVKGVDIRDYGSGNTGVTNVLRTVGKGPAALVLVGDALKGLASVYIGFCLGDNSLSYAIAGGLAAIAGHTYPLYHGFKGGKGAATGFGVILALIPDVTLIAVTVFVLTILLTRYVSLGSILGSVSVPISAVLFRKPLPVVVFCFVAAGFVIYRHRSNIIRLYRGKENKLEHQK